MGDSMPQRFLDARDKHDGAALAALFALDGTYEDLPAGAIHEGRDVIQGLVEKAVKWSNDYRYTLVTEQSSEDRYALEWEIAGTNTGNMGRLPATNKPFRFRGVSIGRLDADGMIKENRDYYNVADYLTQVGIVPPQGT